MEREGKLGKHSNWQMTSNSKQDMISQKDAQKSVKDGGTNLKRPANKQND